jgi:hypothetical protein
MRVFIIINYNYKWKLIQNHVISERDIHRWGALWPKESVEEPDCLEQER